MKYLCLAYYDNRIDALPKDEVKALVSQCRAHDEALHKSGHLLAVASLQSPRMSRSVRPRNEKPSVTDGPFVNTSFMMGGALGLVVLASLAAARSDNLLESGTSSLVALNGGYHIAFVVGAVFAAAAAVLGAVLLRAGLQAPAHESEQAIEA